MLYVNKEETCSNCPTVGTIDKTGLCHECLLLQVENDMENEKATQDDREMKERLMVVLTNEEINEYGKEMSSLIVEKGKIEAERAVLNKKMKPMADRVEELAPIIDAGEEERPVDCRLIYQWDRAVKILIRNDTEQIVSVKEISDFERQQPLDLQKQKEEEEKLQEGRVEEDDVMLRALIVIAESGQASISIIQRNLRLGYNRAASLIETLEEEGLIGPSNGTAEPREVFTDKVYERISELQTAEPTEEDADDSDNTESGETQENTEENTEKAA